MSFIINGYLKRKAATWKRDYLKVYLGGEWKWRPAYMWNGTNWKYVDTLGEIIPADAVGAFAISGDYSDIDTVTVGGAFDITSGYSDA